ncbi:hypothetical protein H6F43_10640, partial [Leptolyngbya sp. FACHB-36]|uniref:hypothetical protein n=1 Tax=Leptolyngbya sp. FACHB-36 TaxID=2692808 RepID=UPI0016807AB2
MSTAPTSIAPVSAGSAIKPQTLEEKVVWYYILGMYPLYFLGLLPFAATIVGLLAPAYVFFNWLRQPDDAPKQDRVRIPVGVWVWIAFMVVIQVTLIAAHVDFGMSDRVWRTSARMATKGFYVLTFFIIAGGCLNIRPQILYRATSIFCVQNLVASAIVYVWSRTGAESITYMPPLAGKTGGYPILLYLVEGGENRQWLFAPWAPALGFAAAIYLCLVYRDPNKWLRLLAILGVIAMVLGSGSRTGRVCLIAVPIFTWVLSNFLLRPGVQMLTGVGGFVAGVIGPQIFQFLKDYRASLDAERAGSTEVREA